MSKLMESGGTENLDSLLKEFKKKKLIKTKVVKAKSAYKKPSQKRKEQIAKAIRVQRYKQEHGLV